MIARKRMAVPGMISAGGSERPFGGGHGTGEERMPQQTAARRARVARDADGRPALFQSPASPGYWVARATDGRYYQFSAGRMGAWEQRSPFYGAGLLEPLTLDAALEAERLAQWEPPA